MRFGMLTSSFPRAFVSAVVLGVAVLCAAPTPASAAQGDCGKPLYGGALPVAGDCLFILRNAVNSETCDPACVCDTTGDGNVTASDALVCLLRAVGQSVGMRCPAPCIPTTCEIPDRDGIIGCEGPLDTCTSGSFVSQAGSDFDFGWNGFAHDEGFLRGGSITIRAVRRCVDHRTIACFVDSDCPVGDRCRPLCDCDDPAKSVCEITGPTVEPRCVRDLTPCSIDADCGTGGHCARFLGPPLPLSVHQTPACVTTFFAEDLTGTADTRSGEVRATAFLRSRVYLGITDDMPCPRCGGASQDPQVGQRFNCEGGPNHGQACTVDAVSSEFGGVSNDCSPDATLNVSGQGLAIRLQNLTTGTDSVQAKVPCVASGTCTDDGSACSSNADCRRCDDDLSPCIDSSDCFGGSCATAPSQPITCGFFCHCGFCDDDPDQPCFDDAECDDGKTCQAGDSFSGVQGEPNGCADHICGRWEPERCCTTGDANCPEATPLLGKCALKPFIQCNLDSECANQQGGTCILEKRPCFGHSISRTGEASPLGHHCVDDANADVCTTNADCVSGNCVDDTAAPSLVALFCVGRTSNATPNYAGGIPGPGALTAKGVVLACRCGDGVVGCGEQCDDGNNANGDGCDQACRDE